MTLEPLENKAWGEHEKKAPDFAFLTLQLNLGDCKTASDLLFMHLSNAVQLKPIVLTFCLCCCIALWQLLWWTFFFFLDRVESHLWGIVVSMPASQLSGSVF